MEPAVKIPKKKIPPHPQGNQSPCRPLRDPLIHPLLQVYLQACSECTLRLSGPHENLLCSPGTTGSVSDTRSCNGVVICFLLQNPQLLRPTEVRGQKWSLNGRPSSDPHSALGVGQRIGLLEASKHWNNGALSRRIPHPSFMQACVGNGLGYSEEDTPSSQSEFSGNAVHAVSNQLFLCKTKCRKHGSSWPKYGAEH